MREGISQKDRQKHAALQPENFSSTKLWIQLEILRELPSLQL